MKTLVATITIGYAKDGAVQSFALTPLLPLDNAKLLDNFNYRKCPDIHSEEEARRFADLMLGTWFASVSDIELANREESELKPELVSCETDREGGKVYVWKYYFQKKGE